jgi:2-polyprenyl-3-methyl-5-hydroxy-6-metoxy-1,4-benzoquinol methylase
MIRRTKASFDRAYYARFYENPKTRVTDRGQVERLAGFVAGYLQYLGLGVRRVLDLGCGMGLWREPLARAFPEARYQGVELSTYLCERFGWTQGSVVDFAAKQPSDLVVCQGVLPYLGAAEARRAIANLANLCRGALYLEAVTTDDFRAGVIDRGRTDAGMQLRSRAFYLRALAPHFVPVGGGVFVARAAQVPLYALERL